MSATPLPIDDPTHPWIDCINHGDLARFARHIAADIVAHERWGVDTQPAYDRQDGHYVGDNRDDRVRCQSHLLSLYLPRGHEMTPDQIADHVYCTLVGGDRWRRYEALRAELDAQVAAGTLVADQPYAAVLRRLIRHRYTVEDLRQELGVTA